MTPSPTTDDLIASHLAAGTRFDAAGVGSFRLDAGEGTPVLLMPGTPAGAFAYRKLVPLLAAQDLRAIAIDVPGIGLAERPAGFVYSTDGMIAWFDAAVEALGLDSFHLLVHGIPAPVPLQWAGNNKERILSLTALNSVFDVTDGRGSGIMKAVSMPGLGEFYLRGLSRKTFMPLFAGQTVADREAVGDDEIAVYLELLKRDDGGKGLLKMLRKSDTGDERQRRLFVGLRDHEFPARIVWGENDSLLGKAQLAAAKDILGIHDPLLLPAKHVPQEDFADPIAAVVADLAAPLG